MTVVNKYPLKRKQQNKKKRKVINYLVMDRYCERADLYHLRLQMNSLKIYSI